MFLKFYHYNLHKVPVTYRYYDGIIVYEQDTGAKAGFEICLKLENKKEPALATLPER